MLIFFAYLLVGGAVGIFVFRGDAKAGRTPKWNELLACMFLFGFLWALVLPFVAADALKKMSFPRANRLSTKALYKIAGR